MEASELKLALFNKIDSLDKKSLEEFYGLFLNFINLKDDQNEWEAYSDFEKEKLQAGIDSLNEGKKVYHKDIMRKYLRKYSDDK